MISDEFLRLSTEISREAYRKAFNKFNKMQFPTHEYADCFKVIEAEAEVVNDV